MAPSKIAPARKGWARRPRQRDNKHLAFVRSLPCIVCGLEGSTEAAHVRSPDPRYDKPLTGVGIKPDDRYTLPLCRAHHREQHTTRESVWWAARGIDPVRTALRLYENTGVGPVRPVRSVIPR